MWKCLCLLTTAICDFSFIFIAAAEYNSFGYVCMDTHTQRVFVCVSVTNGNQQIGISRFSLSSEPQTHISASIIMGRTQYIRINGIPLQFLLRSSTAVVQIENLLTVSTKSWRKNNGAKTKPPLMFPWIRCFSLLLLRCCFFKC